MTGSRLVTTDTKACTNDVSPIVLETVSLRREAPDQRHKLKPNCGCLYIRGHQEPGASVLPQANVFVSFSSSLLRPHDVSDGEFFP